MEPLVEVSDYQPGDYADTMLLWQQTGLGGAQRGDNREIIESSIGMGGRLLVAKNEKGQLVGTSWMTFDGRRLHLHHFGVKPEFQRQGIGKILVEKSLQFAKQKGFQIKLEVHRSNKPAIELYKKYGFAYLGDYDVYILRDLSSIPYQHSG